MISLASHSSVTSKCGCKTEIYRSDRASKHVASWLIILIIISYGSSFLDDVKCGREKRNMLQSLLIFDL